MSSERKYFAIESGSELETVINTFEEDRKNVVVEWRSFAKSVGGNPDRMLAGNALIGLAFAGEPPYGWIEIKAHEGFYKPHGGMAKLESKAMKNLPLSINASDLAGRLKIESVMYHEGSQTYIAHAFYERVGDQLILTLHKKQKTPKADGLIPLKMSEYWQIKEDAA